MPNRSAELFDSHLHLTDEQFKGEVDQVVRRAREANVTRMVTVASDATDSLAARDAARQHGIFSTAGIHPHAASTFTVSSMDSIRSLLDEPEVVAVGETGLDFHYDNSPRAIQRASFEASPHGKEALRFIDLLDKNRSRSQAVKESKIDDTTLSALHRDIRNAFKPDV